MKKISTVFVVGIVMFTLAGCVPGETVVTISADDVGCVMTGGVGRAEVVTILKSSILKFDLSKMSKKIWRELKMGFSHFEKSFLAKSKKIRIVGEGADKFKVEGLRIVPLRR